MEEATFDGRSFDGSIGSSIKNISIFQSIALTLIILDGFIRWRCICKYHPAYSYIISVKNIS